MAIARRNSTGQASREKMPVHSVIAVDNSNGCVFGSIGSRLNSPVFFVSVVLSQEIQQQQQQQNVGNLLSAMPKKSPAKSIAEFVCRVGRHWIVCVRLVHYNFVWNASLIPIVLCMWHKRAKFAFYFWSSCCCCCRKTESIIQISLIERRHSAAMDAHQSDWSALPAQKLRARSKETWNESNHVPVMAIARKRTFHANQIVSYRPKLVIRNINCCFYS